MKYAFASLALVAATTFALPTAQDIDYTSGVDFTKIDYPAGTGENLPSYPHGTGENLPFYPPATGSG